MKYKKAQIRIRKQKNKIVLLWRILFFLDHLMIESWNMNLGALKVNTLSDKIESINVLYSKISINL